MKKFIVPIVSILGLFLVVFVVLASTDRTTTAALLGAGYSAFLMAICAYSGHKESELQHVVFSAR